MWPADYHVHMATSRALTAAVHQEEGWYIAQCLEVDVASQGQTVQEALKSLAEAVEFYLSEVDDPDQQSIGFDHARTKGSDRAGRTT